MDTDRRLFFKKATLGIASGVTLMTPKYAKAKEQNTRSKMGSYIDLTLCDGCKHLDTPQCVSSCKDKNSIHFPEPKKPIKPYWPRKKYEDWSDKRDKIDRLTPYNWTFVEKVKVDNEEIFIPRRCMHCDNPSCLNLCPFGTIDKTKEGLVRIDHDYCMGGAKCRDVCPWGIPSRQAGVGLYLKLIPTLAGGGVMYKCDGCADLVSKNETPACQSSCPKNAIKFGDFETIKKEALTKAKKIKGYTYGLNQGGGTSTIYISKVPFEKINQAIISDKNSRNDKKPGRPHMKVDIKDNMDDATNWMIASLIAPVAGISAAAIAVHKSSKGDKNADN
jgi:Fe-S-cluster-containing dehydrogenase component